MPLFEYECPRCAVRFERLIRRDATVACPDCGHDHPRKLISAPSAPHASRRDSLPVAAGCLPADAPPCHPHCCRLER
ncbi:MAG: zinc ribbon domain-containing protein [Planctomycetaceae bacterium]